MPAFPLSGPRPARTGAAALAAVTVAAGGVLLAAPSALAAPGDNGDVKVHQPNTPTGDLRDEPKVCEFYLDATNFDTVPTLSWTIEPQPKSTSTSTLTGTLTLQEGTGRTPAQSLPDGQYKLSWTVPGNPTANKQKVFKVECAKTNAAPEPGPSGGVAAGGGGLAEPSVSQVGAAAAVGLVGVSGFAYVRMLHRRTDGAA
ncbi:hypothetical protein GCM10010358_47890 [Streptomyces minutiscleroticus]|uniref:Secreted protein n=1 Tax=Streptomyces minutiscleroticus TaxID=68238 RepID=A0A918NQR6_9ACTN|nr:hypothetical protein [Streptomyces minutiscleroticus]GGX88230.1 hypothetical protein GCM10010358_47890 [Streptomyces minutiscleroticus]